MKQLNLFQTIREWLLEWEFQLIYESVDNKVFIIEKETDGIKNMMIAIAPQILIVEQFLFYCKNNKQNIFKELLIKNRDIVHGAFVLDETGEKVIFRNTLQAENLDQNELMSTINSLSLLLSEYSSEMIEYSKD
ncbi:molecular chaperone Tir [Riemerella anatipestifer]|uniref:molecular chaperone Tir n=1 Tax=Riemerella anatipestifer TaxID=34085 RepID=UPI000D1423E8|nr:molecular chaperone Tir [Riemerella anatipestifer]PST44501.1 molecular chaperone Tir [Riemerella anatipestifer]